MSTNTNLRTKIHVYCFNMRDKDERTQWEALKARLEAQKLHCMDGCNRSFHLPESACRKWKKLDGREIELETTHLFSNQWNTAPIPGISEQGMRVFDWALDYDPGCPDVRRGHWLEQTPKMSEIRRNTCACGYCGKQEPAAKGLVFCDKCLGSEYLKSAELHLLRMVPVCAHNPKRAPLTEAERAHLMPLYSEAQLRGKGERSDHYFASHIKEVTAKAEEATRNAQEERDGMLWLLERRISIENVIYYTHTGRFGIGWRSPVDEAFRSMLLDVLAAFPFAYDMICSDGKTLSN